MAFEDVKISKTLVVYSNDSDEVFVTNRKSGVVIRISDNSDNITVTAAGYRISPTSVNGLDAFRVSKAASSVYHAGTVYHNGIPAHDSSRCRHTEEKTQLNYCVRCGDWFEPVKKMEIFE